MALSAQPLLAAACNLSMYSFAAGILKSRAGAGTLLTPALTQGSPSSVAGHSDAYTAVVMVFGWAAAHEQSWCRNLVGVDAIVNGPLQVIQQLICGRAQHNCGHSACAGVLLQDDHGGAADLGHAQRLGVAQLVCRGRPQPRQRSRSRRPAGQTKLFAIGVVSRGHQKQKLPTS